MPLRPSSCSGGQPTGAQRACIASVLVTVTLALSVVVPNLGTVLAYNGAVFGVAQQLLLPRFVVLYWDA